MSVLAVYIVQFLVWGVVVFGITQILVEGTVMNGFRKWVSTRSAFGGRLLSCMLCTGVWVGFILSLLFWSPTGDLFTEQVINFRRMTELQLHINMSRDIIDNLLSRFIFLIEFTIDKFSFGLLDAMIAGVFSWWMHLIERVMIKFGNE